MDKVDVVIVGSGASGSLMAAKLSQAGKTVVVLEGGPEHTTNDMYSSQIWARRLKWFGPATELQGSDPLSVAFASGWGTLLIDLVGLSIPWIGNFFLRGRLSDTLGTVYQASEWEQAEGAFNFCCQQANLTALRFRQNTCELLRDRERLF